MTRKTLQFVALPTDQDQERYNAPSKREGREGGLGRTKGGGELGKMKGGGRREKMKEGR